MTTVEGYHLRPSATVLRLREDFPDFLIFELRNERCLPSFVATCTRNGDGRPELIVRGCAEQLRQALETLGGDQA
ncbi:hypothetical protein [Nocardiopsis kunsanensis]|uniref:Uncharacterized protein n=1 Tax=Nocardiopsis kunsanensis TaxID=141693 RepID=A0A918XBE1_9ACTN|nr:hypothetical protein [Nocardiopsis kunsanensis]GHD24683.1 hypothetical protein GCM10007147_21050 [Nocardiopsis kunsanensis]